MTEQTGRTFIALGTNLPFQGLEGPALLLAALESIAGAHVKVRNRSSFWASPPWPPDLEGQPPYVNAVAEIDPGPLDAPGLFALLTKIEAEYGRERRDRWAARTLDLDIIDFKGAVGEWNGIALPHPRIQERAFVLAPLADIAPDWRHPVLDRSASDLLARLGSGQEITRIPADCGASH